MQSSKSWCILALTWMALPAAAWNSVQFRVLDEGGQPVRNAWVRIDFRNLDGQRSIEWRTNSLGLTQAWDGGGAGFNWVANFRIMDSAQVDTLLVRDTITKQDMDDGDPRNEGDQFNLLRTFRLSYRWIKSPFPQDSGTITIPGVPYQILYDPPGDGSFATLEQTSAVQTSVRTSFGTSTGASLSFGYSYEAPLGIAGAEFEVSASVNYRQRTDNEFTATITNTQALSTAASGSTLVTGPGRGDLFVAPSLTLRWNLFRAHKPLDPRARPDGHVYKLFYRPIRDTSSTLLVVTADWLRQRLSDNPGVLDQVLGASVIDPLTGRIRSGLVDRATGTPLTDRLVLDQGAQLLSGGVSSSRSYSREVTQSTTVTHEFEIGAEAMAKVTAGGASVGTRLSVSVTTGRTQGTASTLTRTFGQTWTDDDPWDQIRMRVYRDTRFGVFVFDVDSSQSWTSLPHESRYSSPSVDWVVQTVDSLLEVPVGSPAEFEILVRNENRPGFSSLDTITSIMVTAIRTSGARVTVDPVELNSPRGVERVVSVSASAVDTGNHLIEIKLQGIIEGGTPLEIVVPLVLRARPASSLLRPSHASLWTLDRNTLSLRPQAKSWSLRLYDLAGREVLVREGIGSADLALPASEGILIGHLEVQGTTRVIGIPAVR